MKAQAQAAEQVKREREDQERRQRRARAEEAAEAERLRRSGRGSKRKRNTDDEVWDRWDGRTADRMRTSKNWDTWDRPEGNSDHDYDRSEGYRRGRSMSRSREEDTRKPRQSRSDVDEEEVTSRKWRRHHRSLSYSPRTVDPYLDQREREPHHRKQRRSQEEHRHTRSRRSHSRFASPASGTEGNKSKKRRRSRSPRHAFDDTTDKTPPIASHRYSSLDVEIRPNAPEANLETRLKASQGQNQPSSNPHSKHKNNSESHASSTKRSPSTGTPSRSPSPGPQLPIQLPSKMDRYFEESYDPRLDVAPLAAPKVPATGLIDNTEFEGWDAMLELIRARREDKEEKKRMERLGLLPKAKGKSKKNGPILDSSLAVADRWGGDGVTVMDIEYKKRGTVREWDVGKEGF